MSGLEAHDARVAHDLACIGWGMPDWTKPRVHPQGPVYDAIIIGAGQSGLGAAFALKRERISNILLLDENPAGQEGPWITYARMMTLRTPKSLTSIDMGVPALTFRAWWEAQHGAASWDAIDKIPRADWMAYLRWYRAVLDLPVRNEARVSRIEPVPDEQLHKVHLADGETLIARKVILATGIQGGGEWHVPGFISDALPAHLYAHTSAAIDFAALTGKRIAILGGGASAFDNAQHALGLGVGGVDLFMRRKEMPRVNPIRFMEQNGVIPRFAGLGDGEKYALMANFFARNQPPTNDTFARAATYPGFHLHMGSPWLSVAPEGDGVRVETPQGSFLFDFLVLSTGLVTDPALRPELAGIAERIARWRDRYAPPEDASNALVDEHPYLGSGFQYLPREAVDAPLLHGLFAFNYSALISMGLSASAISGLRYALPKLGQAVADQLFQDDRAGMMSAYFDYDELEFLGEWPRAANNDDEAA